MSRERKCPTALEQSFSNMTMPVTEQRGKLKNPVRKRMPAGALNSPRLRPETVRKASNNNDSKSWTS